MTEAMMMRLDHVAAGALRRIDAGACGGAVGYVNDVNTITITGVLRDVLYRLDALEGKTQQKPDKIQGADLTRVMTAVHICDDWDPDSDGWIDIDIDADDIGDDTED